MSLRRQIVENEVDRVASLLKLPQGLAFLRFAHHLLTGRSLHTFDDDLVDGGQDKQIDVITLDSDESAADVWIIQAKASPSVSTNVLVQMASTLAAAQKERILRPNVRVMARIYEAPKTGLVDKIVLTTKNQNRIRNRDLRANDAVQVDVERGFAIYGLLYERKQRQHDSKAEDQKQIVPNGAVGQWYLAVVL